MIYKMREAFKKLVIGQEIFTWADLLWDDGSETFVDFEAEAAWQTYQATLASIATMGKRTYKDAPEFMSHEERCGYAAGWNSLLRKLQAEIE